MTNAFQPICGGCGQAIVDGRWHYRNENYFHCDHCSLNDSLMRAFKAWRDARNAYLAAGTDAYEGATPTLWDQYNNAELVLAALARDLR